MRDFKLSDKQMEKIVDSLDGTGGFLVKESELRYWIEYFVDREIKKHIEKTGDNNGSKN